MDKQKTGEIVCMHVCVDREELGEQFQNVHFCGAVGYKWIACFA